MSNSIEFVLDKIKEREQYITAINCELSKLYVNDHRLELVKEKIRAEEQIKQLYDGISPLELTQMLDKLTNKEKEMLKKLAKHRPEKILTALQGLSIL